MRLPNGWKVLQLNSGETSLQYRDIVQSRAYLRYGLRVERGAVVFDVGANIGMSCLSFHAEAPGVRIFAFEPAPKLLAPLRANMLAHGVDARVVACALGRTRGHAEFTYYPHVNVMTSMYADPDRDMQVTRTFLVNSGFDASDVEDLLDGLHATESFTAEVRTVSDVVAEFGVERIDLLKVNVEKAESDVLAGIADDDWPKVRQLTMQVHDLRVPVDEVAAQLAARGFAVDVDQDPLLVDTDVFDLYARRPE